MISMKFQLSNMFPQSCVICRKLVMPSQGNYRKKILEINEKVSYDVWHTQYCAEEYFKRLRQLEIS